MSQSGKIKVFKDVQCFQSHDSLTVWRYFP